MHLLNETKSSVGKAMRHYMGMRLKFRGTVFAESRLANTTTCPESCQISQPSEKPQQASVEH